MQAPWSRFTRSPLEYAIFRFLCTSTRIFFACGGLAVFPSVSQATARASTWACVLLIMLTLPAVGSCSAALGRRCFFESPAGSRSTSALALAHELPLELPSQRVVEDRRSCCRCRCRRRCRSHRRRRLRRSLPASLPLPSLPPPPLSCSHVLVPVSWPCPSHEC